MSINDELQARRDKMAKLKKYNIQPYPEKYNVNTNTKFLAELSHSNLPDLISLSKKLDSKYSLAGRIMTWREHGKIIFANIQDSYGNIQIAFSKEVLKKQFDQLDILDRGDWLGLEGDMFLTKKGEPTLLVNQWTLLSKALRPLPEKWHGLKDQEIIYRQRYLDLIMNPETKAIFEFRSNLIKVLREFYWQEGFMEVETPTFMHSATGANAKPYLTHNNALDIDVYLRISVELPLKELIASGFNKIFEIGKVFRNEGIDPSHLPEHTHVEHYSAFWNWEDNIKFTEKLVNYIFDKLNLNRQREVLNREGELVKVNFTTPFKRLDYIKILKNDTGLDILKYKNANKLRQDLKKNKISFEGMDQMSLTNLVDNMYKKVSRPKIINPCIIYNYPDYMQPLARRNDKNPKLVDQFQLIVNGWELVKAYSELVDPDDQRQRFLEQAQAKTKGDEDAQEGDEDYLIAMEHGMPPISGWGLGIDRLVAILTKQSNLRDVVLFPLLRPEKENPADK